ncbi:hypothetical protein Tco_0791133 [Tanacetum coccineum]
MRCAAVLSYSMGKEISGLNLKAGSAKEKSSEVTPTEVIQDQGSSEKGNSEVSTARATKGTASEVLVVSTAEGTDYKGMKTFLEMGWKRKAKSMLKSKSSKKIEGMIFSHKGCYIEIRLIFEKFGILTNYIVPMDLEHGSVRRNFLEKIEEEDVDTQQEMKEDVRRKILKGYLDIVPREDVTEDVESLSTKYPIVDGKTFVLTENFMYYQIFRGDGSSKNYKILSEMLEDFDRQDVMDLHRLVKERYSASRPEGYDLMLWGDLHIPI